MNDDPAVLIIRVAVAVIVVSGAWIVGSLLVDIVRLMRGARSTRTIMGVVARYLVASATVTAIATVSVERAPGCHATSRTSTCCRSAA
jgi:hypothetical protein